MAESIVSGGKAHKLIAESEIVKSERNKLYFELIMETRKGETKVNHERINSRLRKLYSRSKNLAVEAKIYWKTVYGSTTNPNHIIYQMWTQPINSLSEVEKIFGDYNLLEEELYMLTKLLEIEQAHWFK
jgi:hypothetical protein